MKKIKSTGELFKALIEEKGLSVYSFSKKARYSNSRIYAICNNQFDVRTIHVCNAKVFATVLGFKTIDEFYKALNIDLLESI